MDITDALKHGNGGKHELIVRVYDPTDSAHIPLGKQRKNNGGIFYMGTEGIWQTVWLERVWFHLPCISVDLLEVYTLFPCSNCSQGAIRDLW